MKRILLAVDGSDHSQRATELATDIATKYDAKLLLLNVVDNRPLSEAERKLAELEFSSELKQRTDGSNWPDINLVGDQGVGSMFQHHAEISRIIRTTIGEGVHDGLVTCAEGRVVISEGSLDAAIDVGKELTSRLQPFAFLMKTGSQRVFKQIIGCSTQGLPPS